MSWRRFRTLYANLSPHSATFRNYSRIERKWNAATPAATPTAWDTFTGLAKPKG